MLIQERISIREVLHFIVFVLLLFATVAAGFGSRKGTWELSWSNQIDSGEIDEDLAKQLSAHCRLELIHAKEAVEDLELYAAAEKFRDTDEIIRESRSSRLLAKENVQKIANFLNHQVKQTLLDCLKKKNPTLLVSGNDNSSKNWYSKYLERLFAAPRGRELRQIFLEAPAPSPASASYGPAPSSSEGPNTEHPAGPPSKPFFPPDLNDSSLEPTASSTTPDSASNEKSNKQKNNRKTVVVAVVVTAVVTSVVVALLFFCYRRSCLTGSAAGKKDERPLLSLSLSDYSDGSHKSFAPVNSINKGNPGNQSFYANSNHNTVALSLNGKFHLEPNFLNASKVETPLAAAAGATASSIEDSAQIPHPQKLPPGRLGPSVTGRLDTSEPPPPGKAAPPAPPPSLKPPSGGSHPPPPGPPPPPPVPIGNKMNPHPPPPPGPPPPPPIPIGNKMNPHPPPPPGVGVPPPRPPAVGLKPPRPSPLGPNQPSSTGSAEESGADAPKAKLKPFFWDKVLANPDHSMVWHQIKSGSFQFNEEMIETLFGYAPTAKNKSDRKRESSSQDPSPQYIQIINPKKSQNLAIMLKALNVTTEEVRDALEEGNELPPELIQTLLKMAPTAEEEVKLRLYSGELSRLGPAERFLKVLIDIPYTFKRLESLLFMCTLQEEASMIKESFATLDAACTELRNSRLFLKLLEAVLKTGNRMNDGTFRGGAQAFKLDTLLKLSDVKGVDGKTTLLHFVVQEIIRSEGVRAVRTARKSQSTSSIKSDDILEDSAHDSEEHYRNLGLQVISGLGGELENVRKAAVLDADSVRGAVAKLGHALLEAQDFLNSDMKNIDKENRFHQTLKNFVQNAEVDVMWLHEEEKRIMALVKRTADYFHGNAGKDEGLRLFVIVRDFLIMLDKACKDVKNTPVKLDKTQKKEDLTITPSLEPHQSPSLDPREKLFPAIRDRRMDYSSSDDDSE